MDFCSFDGARAAGRTFAYSSNVAGFREMDVRIQGSWCVECCLHGPGAAVKNPRGVWLGFHLFFCGCAWIVPSSRAADYNFAGVCLSNQHPSGVREHVVDNYHALLSSWLSVSERKRERERGRERARDRVREGYACKCILSCSSCFLLTLPSRGTATILYVVLTESSEQKPVGRCPPCV